MHSEISGWRYKYLQISKSIVQLCQIKTVLLFINVLNCVTKEIMSGTDVTFVMIMAQTHY